MQRTWHLCCWEACHSHRLARSCISEAVGSGNASAPGECRSRSAGPATVIRYAGGLAAAQELLLHVPRALVLQSIAGSRSPRRLLRDACLGHRGGRLESVTCCYLKWGLSKEAQLDIWYSGIPGPSAKEPQEIIPCSLTVFIFTSRIVEAGDCPLTPDSVPIWGGKRLTYNFWLSSRERPGWYWSFVVLLIHFKSEIGLYLCDVCSFVLLPILARPKSGNIRETNSDGLPGAEVPGT